MASEQSGDQRILTLAAEIAEATDFEVPQLLLKVRDVLEEAKNNPRKLATIREEIWNYEILQVLVLVLKQNFDYIKGEWKTGAELATFASNVCIGLEPADTHSYYGICLPNTADNILILARKLQVIYSEDKNEERKKINLDNFRTIIESLNTLFSAHIFLTINVLRSPWLLQMLLSDEVDTCLSVLNLVQYSIRVNTKVLSSLDEKVIHSLLDELIFKLASGDDKYLAGSAIRCLVLICQIKPYYIQIVCNRYRGLRPLMNKWSGQGIGKDFRDFTAILDAGNAHRAETEKFHRAATLIQAVYRSFQIRQRLKKANVVFSKFHRSFRAQKAKKEKREDERKEQSALQHQLLIARKTAMRQTREKRMQILGMLPAKSIPKYLEDVRDQAALTIQTSWRGFTVRKELAARKENMKKIRAAVKIQRGVRKFLAKLNRIKSEPPTWYRPDGLTDERRVYLQNVIKERREAYPPKVSTRAEEETLHNECQQLLKRHVYTTRANMRKQLHRAALLAELSTDANLILSAPRLKDVEPTDLDKYKSVSLPISMKAKDHHHTAMHKLNQPWWKKLTDVDDEPTYDGDHHLLSIQ